MSDLVSVLMCTRGRPTDAQGAVRSLLASVGVELEVIVIDQSDDTDTAEILEGLHDDRVRYVRSATRGLGAGLDEGLRLARSPYVVHTDDDCEAPPDWVAGMAAILEEMPKVAVVFSNVVAGPYDPKAGFVPVHIRKRDRLIRSVIQTRGQPGMGAGMAMRRDAVLAVGGFDPAMGAGARFFSMDDWDVELRVLLAGWESFHTAQIFVIHHGFRTFAQGHDHTKRNWLGLGAGLAKLTRGGHPSALGLAAMEIWLNVLVPMLRDIVHLRRPVGLRRIVWFAQGFVEGFRTPVDRATLRFAPKN